MLLGNRRAKPGQGYWTSSAYPVKQEDEEEFEQNCLDTLEEMILANRNHPSIIVWSMSNEPFFTEAATLEKAKRLLRKLVAKSHQLDPTRPAAAGGAQRGDFDIWEILQGTMEMEPACIRTQDSPISYLNTEVWFRTGRERQNPDTGMVWKNSSPGDPEKLCGAGSITEAFSEIWDTWG